MLLPTESHALSTSAGRTSVEGRAVHKTHLNHPSDSVSGNSMGVSNGSKTMTITNTAPFTYSIASILDLDSKDNFVATQV